MTFLRVGQPVPFVHAHYPPSLFDLFVPADTDQFVPAGLFARDGPCPGKVAADDARHHLDHERRVVRMAGASGWPEHLAEAILGVEVPYDATPLIAAIVEGSHPVTVTAGSGDPVADALLEQFEAGAAMVASIVRGDEAYGLVAGVRRRDRVGAAPIDERLAELIRAATGYTGTGSVAETIDDVKRLFDLGFTTMIVRNRGTTAAELTTQIDRFVAEIVPKA